MPKGVVTNPNGRTKGVPNKATAAAREAIAAFVDKQTPRLEGLLNKIEKESGALAAFNCIRDLIEYHVPKLARTEHAGEMKVVHDVTEDKAVINQFLTGGK